MFWCTILDAKLFIMSSIHFKRSFEREYPEIESDTTNCTEHLSDENICGSVRVRNESVTSNARIIECKTEDCTDFGDVSSISGSKLKQDDKVRICDARFVVLYWVGEKVISVF